MTAREKARELVIKMYGCYAEDLDRVIIEHTNEFLIAQDNALIAVNEIIESHYKVFTGINNSTLEYWQQVKNEIESL